MKMEIQFSSNFQKAFKKAPHYIQVALQKKIKVFRHDPYDRKLRNHKLKGSYSAYRSIDITGDWRGIYREIKQDDNVVAFFHELGTHSQLYR